jgi:heptaprenyl diphosphate synthase
MSHQKSISSNFGLTDALSSTPEERELVARLNAGVTRMEESLESNLHFGDAHTDTIARYLFEAGGKRVRPLLALIAAEYGDPTHEDIIMGAQVVELIHLATLYHDDVMDDADLRRGVPTTHTVWSNSVAIITGDLLLARASSLASTLGDDMVRLHAATFERLCLGQLHETTGPQNGADPVAHYLQVLADKTGSLIASSAVVGLMTSGAPREYFEPLREFGEKIGVAFQIIDDVLDLDGGETGKEKGNDVRNGVATLPILLARAADDAESRSLVERIDVAIDSADAAAFALLMDELRGSRHTAETIASARRWATEAVAALEILPDGLPKNSLARFASRVIDRTN